MLFGVKGNYGVKYVAKKQKSKPSTKKPLIDGEFDPKTWAKEQKTEAPEIRILKKDNADLRAQLERQETGVSLIIQAVKDCYSEPPDLIIPPAPKYKSHKAEEIAVMHLSDTQLGKRTATYSSAVGALRIMEYAKKVVEITNVRRSGASIKELRIYMLGDLIEGEQIFPGQAYEIDQVLFEQCVRTAPTIFSNMILYLLQHFEKIRVCDVPGNHGRNGRFGNGSSRKTNWDRAVGEIIEMMLMGTKDNPRKELEGRLEFVHVDDDSAWYIVDYVYDWGYLLHHGDSYSGGFAGFPWYGVAKKSWGWIDSIPEPWDFNVFGHFHTYASAVLNHRIFYCNGTTESSNVYAQQQLAAAGFPCQRLQFVNDKHGIISDHQVFLTVDNSDESRVPSKLRHTKWKK